MIHEALIHDTDEELVDGTRVLIRDGIAAGDLVVVGGGDHDLEVLRDAWDDDPRVVFENVSTGYDNPMTTLGNYQRLSEQEESAGRRARVTAALPPLDGAEARRRWRRYEAVVARALAPYELVALCRYDTRTMPPEMVDHARATHQRVTSPQGLQEGAALDRVLAELAASERPDPAEATPPVLQRAISSTSALAGLRGELAAALPSSDRSTGLLTAANEVLTNALQHGRAPVDLSLHRGSDRWVCVVADAGDELDDPWVGFDPPVRSDSESGRGLWIARQLCDDLTISTAGAGTTVRLLLDA